MTVDQLVTALVGLNPVGIASADSLSYSDLPALRHEVQARLAARGIRHSFVLLTLPSRLEITLDQTVRAESDALHVVRRNRRNRGRGSTKRWLLETRNGQEWPGAL